MKVASTERQVTWHSRSSASTHPSISRAPRHKRASSNDALESEDAAYISNALGLVARARGMTALAKETGLSRQALYAALSENGNPSLDTIVKVTKALGIQLHAEVAVNKARVASA